jgi:Holliday junction resolvase-like predicted endonuclease
MTLEETKRPGFEFKKAIEKGKKYEAKIQSKIEEVSQGSVFNNVRIRAICEFDAIVADYPILTFVEIKAYRQNCRRARVRQAVRKLKQDACEVVEDESLKYSCWTPYISREKDRGEVTNRELLFKKLELGIREGWKFRLVLIVPNKVLGRVMACLISHRYSDNVLDIDGVPLLVIPEKRINDVF